MHVTITGVPRGSLSTGEKVEKLVVPFVQSLRDAYVAANISDDHSATVDLLTDILVYAHKVERVDIDELIESVMRSYHGEIYDAEHGA